MVKVYLMKLSNKNYFFNYLPKSNSYIENLNDKNVVNKIIEEIKEILNDKRIENVIEHNKNIAPFPSIIPNNDTEVAPYNIGNVLKSPPKETMRFIDNLFYKVDITPYLTNVSINNSPEGLSAEINALLKIDDFSIEYINFGSYNLYLNDFIIIENNNKPIFYGFVDSISCNLSVDGNVSYGVNLYSYSNLLKDSIMVITESLINKIYTDQNTQNKTSRQFFSNSKRLTILSDIFQDKPISEILSYIIKDRLMCGDNLTFNFINFIEKSKKIVSNNAIIPSFYILFCMHCAKDSENILEFKDNINIKPYLNMIASGMSLTDSIYKSPYDIIKETCETLLLEFYEGFGNTLFIKKKFYFNITKKGSEDSDYIKKYNMLNNIYSFSFSNSNSKNSNIFVTTFVADLISQVSELINGTFYDDISIYRNNFIYNNETYISPYGREYLTLSKLSQLKYQLNMLNNVSYFDLGFFYKIDDDIPIIDLYTISQIYGGPNVTKFNNIYIYPESITINFNVDDNVSYRITGKLYCLDLVLFGKILKALNVFYSLVITQNKEEYVKSSHEYKIMVDENIDNYGLYVILNSEVLYNYVKEKYNKFVKEIEDFYNKSISNPYIEITDATMRSILDFINNKYKEMVESNISFSNKTPVMLDVPIENPSLVRDSKKINFSSTNLSLKENLNIITELYLDSIFLHEIDNVSNNEYQISIRNKILRILKSFDPLIIKITALSSLLDKENEKLILKSLKSTRISYINCINELLKERARINKKSNTKKEESKDIKKR